MICAKNCEKVSKFIEVTGKILSVIFLGHGIMCFKGNQTASINMT